MVAGAALGPSPLSCATPGIVRRDCLVAAQTPEAMLTVDTCLPGARPLRVPWHYNACGGSLRSGIGIMRIVHATIESMHGNGLPSYSWCFFSDGIACVAVPQVSMLSISG